MDKENYEIRRFGDYLVIYRVIYPRIRVYVCYSRLIPEIVRISLLDKCSGLIIAPAIKDINQLISDLDPSAF